MQDAHNVPARYYGLPPLPTSTCRLKRNATTCASAPPGVRPWNIDLRLPSCLVSPRPLFDNRGMPTTTPTTLSYTTTAPGHLLGHPFPLLHRTPTTAEPPIQPTPRLVQRRTSSTLFSKVSHARRSRLSPLQRSDSPIPIP